MDDMLKVDIRSLYHHEHISPEVLIKNLYRLKEKKDNPYQLDLNEMFGNSLVKVPHITLKSLANNEPPDEETLYDQPEVDNSKMRVPGPFTVETCRATTPFHPKMPFG